MVIPLQINPRTLEAKPSRKESAVRTVNDIDTLAKTEVKL